MTRWTSDVIERRHSLPGIEPGALGLSPKTLRPPLAEDNRSISAHRNGQGDGIRTRTVRVTGGDANCYITTLINWPAEPEPAGEGWSPRSDSHRRIRVYETRPVAAEAQGRGRKYEG